MPNDAIEDLVGGDQRKAQYIRMCLQRLSRGPQGALREMARSVLRGEIDLRSAANTQVYGSELGTAFGRFWSRYQAATPEARQQVIDRAQTYLDNSAGRDSVIGRRPHRPS